MRRTEWEEEQNLGENGDNDKVEVVEVRGEVGVRKKEEV